MAGAVLVGLAVATISWVVSSTLGRSYPIHETEHAVPVALTEAEVAALEVADPTHGLDAPSIALERAVARGKHLVQSRYVCIECHGADFSGGNMIDDPLIGTLDGPNLTRGGVTADYTFTDWDRAVRHGLLRDGRVSLMPSGDFEKMSDDELSDIIAYVRSLPAKEARTRPRSVGPLLAVLIAFGEVDVFADSLDHQAIHLDSPPATEVSVEFGGHLARVCTGCHQDSFVGGPIEAAPPDWLPAANLTPHEDGLKDWTLEDFVRAMKESKRPDGSDVRAPMTLMQPYAARMTDVELEALWVYIQSLEPLPTGT